MHGQPSNMIMSSTSQDCRETVSQESLDLSLQACSQGKTGFFESLHVLLQSKGTLEAVYAQYRLLEIFIKVPKAVLFSYLS